MINQCCKSSGCQRWDPAERRIVGKWLRKAGAWWCAKVASYAGSRESWGLGEMPFPFAPWGRSWIWHLFYFSAQQWLSPLCLTCAGEAMSRHVIWAWPIRITHLPRPLWLGEGGPYNPSWANQSLPWDFCWSIRKKLTFSSGVTTLVRWDVWGPF